MPEIGVQIRGLRETVRSLEKFGVEVADLKAAFRKVGNLVVNEAKSLVPVRTGRLSSTIKTSNTKNKSIVRAGRKLVPYAGVIHYGNYHNIRANPFLTNALANEQPAVVRTLDTELRGLIRSLGLN